MAVTPTAAYITTVNEDHTVAMPSELPVGTTVAVIAVSVPPSDDEDAARRARFETTLAAIRTAMQEQPVAHPGDEDIDLLVERARKRP